jgi:hypothetical protein
VLWRLKRVLLPAEQAIVAHQWATTSGADLVHGVTFGLSFDCNREEPRVAAAGYLSKLALEMSGAGKDAHSEHWTLGELFREATRRADFVPLIQQYQRQTKGRRLYQLDRRAQRLHDAAPEPPQLKVVETWITVVHREEFRELSRRERFGHDALACYLPLEVAIRCRGDPRSQVEDVIYDLICHNHHPQG